MENSLTALTIKELRVIARQCHVKGRSVVMMLYLFFVPSIPQRCDI